MSFFNDLFRRLAPPVSSDSPCFRPVLTPALTRLAAQYTAEAIAPYIGSSNGYIRQAAIARCVALNTPEMLPLLVGRLNDWVPQVRDAARAAILALAPGCPPGALMAILPGVQRLHEARRSDHAEWIDAFAALLAERMSRQALLDTIEAGDTAISRASFQLARACRLIDSNELIALALARPHDVVMAKNALALASRLPFEERRSWHAQFAVSPFLMLRVESFRALLEDGDDAAYTAAVAALRHKATGMRVVAMAFLRRHGFDLRGFYCAVLRDPATPAKLAQIALGALAGQGNKQDIDLIKSCLTASAPAVREAALRAWLKLDPACKDDIALMALHDRAPSLRRYAHAIVKRHGAYIPFEQAQEILLPLRDYTCLILFAESQQWQWLETLVSVVCALAFQPDQDTALATALQRSARRWQCQIARHYTPPAPRQLALFAAPAGQRALRELGISETWLYPL